MLKLVYEKVTLSKQYTEIFNGAQLMHCICEDTTQIECEVHEHCPYEASSLTQTILKHVHGELGPQVDVTVISSMKRYYFYDRYSQNHADLAIARGCRR